MTVSFLDESEILAADRLNSLLAPSRSVVRSLASVLRKCAVHAGEIDESRSARVQNNLLARLSEEIAATSVLSSFGYEMQALVLAASAYEVGHLAAFIAFDEEKAATWLNWTNPARMPWDVRRLTSGALRNAGLFDERRVANQYFWYQGACVAKHANPAIQGRAAVADSDVMRILNADPAFSHRAGAAGFAAMFISAIPGVIALRMFIEKYPLKLEAATVDEIEDVLPRWNTMSDSFQQWRQTRKKRIESESSPTRGPTFLCLRSSNLRGR